jgi:hypothetical protein
MLVSGKNRSPAWSPEDDFEGQRDVASREACQFDVMKINKK